ncbi:glycosyltransferase family 32 protein [Bifidobacterium felsineum]|uniref:Glycosyl transferase n=1 Tax=Bifidobacterium felsineum TaxID=2045440 RepID=A0A2M9HHV7_9BIFI|nr:glycosyltransferase [Bifidobacterium felsineum]PJM76395.1 glycosyl transferase [Bifidobacterium felsineum]
MIPKIIHYCWFGRNPLTEDVLRCINSWKKYMPEYKIIQWNETNFNINCCPYIQEAYAAHKWAFVSDYARFWIISNYGGVYFDTDVELIKSIDDIVSKGPFLGTEYSDTGISIAVNPGLGMADSAGSVFCTHMLNQYNSDHFLLHDGTFNPINVVTRSTNLIRSYGWKMNDEFQIINGIQIFPIEYFCPLNYLTGVLLITPKTRSIHHYKASWLSKGSQGIHSLEQIFRRLLGFRFGTVAAKPFVVSYRFIERLKTLGIKKAFIYYISKRG